MRLFFTLCCLFLHAILFSRSSALFNSDYLLFAHTDECDTMIVFSYTGSSESITIPEGVDVIMVNAFGAEGGAGERGAGGFGGRVSAVISVASGDVLHVFVGGAGEDWNQNGGGGAGGFNGGGMGGNFTAGGGGGATDLRLNGLSLTDRIIVAGAGGGGGANCNSGFGETGGDGGGLVGDNGLSCSNGGPGLGGTQESGGAGGGPVGTFNGTGQPGDFGVGGSTNTVCCGGGGGGGYYGGGAGAYTAGGGGSSYTGPSAYDVIHEQGVHSGNGYLTIVMSCSLGCTDPTACNYLDTAIEDDGSCIYPSEVYLDCEGNCINDTDQNGICDEIEVLGCTDPTACNYEELATQDDGTCDYIDAILIVGDTTPFTLEESTYNCTNTPGSTYEWVVDGGVIASGQGTSSVTVLWAEVGNGVLTVTESTESQCQGTTSLQVQIECSTSTTAIDGPIGPGELLEVVYSCDGDAGSSFDWSISNGVITSGQGTSTVTVIWASTGLGSISVQETTAANCDGDEITLDVVVVFSTGINNVITERIVSVFPNPASDRFKISVDEHLLGSSFNLYDSTGRIVNEGIISCKITEVATADLPSGNYTLVLQSKDEVVRQSVILE